MKRSIKNLFAGVIGMTLMFNLMSCQTTPLSQNHIIPKPVSLVDHGGSFTITDQTQIFYSGESAKVKQIGQFLAEVLNPPLQGEFKVSSSNSTPESGNIYLSLLTEEKDAALCDEGY